MLIVRRVTHAAQRDGNDGPWSSFAVQVGTPSQNVRLLPDTSANTGTSVWVVRPEGCTSDDPSNCGDLRGFIFHPNESSTWSIQGLSNNGLYDLTAYEENLLGYGGNAYYGFDNVTLGWQSDGLPELSHQVVAGYATKDFYVGSLGISPQPILFDTFNHAYPSLLTTLRNRSLIPSSSWAYTAGAYYQEPKVYGSLTLGGYDATRFVPNNVSITFGADSSRDLLVGIQQITSDTLGTPLLSSGIYAFIDSLVPHIWLPINVCAAFEQAFNLTWNSTAELYLLTEDEHSNLVNLNANITIKLGSSAAGNDSVDIVMPYGAFDLTVSSPIVESPTHYFPLKRAQNDTQYTLGRAFLQQAYVIADYDRSNFSVSQALFPATSVAKNIVATLPPDVAPNQKKPPLGKGAMIAIIASALIGFLVTLGIIRYNRRRRRRQPPEPPADIDKKEVTAPLEKPELDHTSTHIAQLDDHSILELDVTEILELSSDQTRQHGNLGESRGDRQRIEAPALTRERQELEDSVPVGKEMSAEPLCMIADGSSSHFDGSLERKLQA